MMRVSILLLAVLVILAITSVTEAKKKKDQSVATGACKVKNCLVCKANGKKCKKCQDGFKLRKRGKKCKAPDVAPTCGVANCAKCTGNGKKCVECKPGFDGIGGRKGKRDACEAEIIIDPVDPVEPKPPGPGGQQPAYLSIPNLDDCLKTVGGMRCMPNGRSGRCPASSFTQLLALFPGDKCEGCNGGGSKDWFADCCKGGNCGPNQGDCDSNEDCEPGTRCGKDNCLGDAFNPTTDCCEYEECDGSKRVSSNCCVNGMCGVNQGDCDSNRDCQPGLVCGYNNCVGPNFTEDDDCCAELSGCDGGDSCCKAANSGNGICGVGEGDCDSNAECQDGLVCGTDNCVGPTFQATDDCCEKPAFGCDGGDSCCVGGNCGDGEGDCDRDSDCMAGLVCGRDNCQGSTFQSSDDCCTPSACDGGDSCCNGDCGEGEGDCDSHSDCLAGLACGVDNCSGSTFQATDDCCYKP